MSKPDVLRNVSRLRSRLADLHFKGDRVSLLINCESGEFSVPQSIEELKSKTPSTKQSSPHQFKHAELKILVSKTGQVSFEWVDSHWNHGLSDPAVALLLATLDAINRSGALTHSGSAKEALALCIRSLKEALPEEIAAQRGWLGNLERIPAETLLAKTRPGTYLLRKGDEFTRELEENLAQQDPQPVRCFVITVAETTNKIAERILIQRPNGWTLYNDDLMLSDYRFTSLSEAITQAGGVKPIDPKAA